MRKAIVLHVDLLGFKEMALTPRKGKILDTIKSAIKSIKRIVEENKIFKYTEESKHEITYKTFSDNLYVSIGYDKDNYKQFADAFFAILDIAANYQVTMANKKILCRGGISFGDDFITDEIIFSQALVQAYKIETEVALFPRIVIDSDIIQILQHLNPIANPLYANSRIIKDWADIYFVNMMYYLENVPGIDQRALVAMDKFRKLQIEMLISQMVNLMSKIKDRGVIIKYKWFINFLRWLNDEETLQKFEFCNFHRPLQTRLTSG